MIIKNMEYLSSLQVHGITPNDQAPFMKNLNEEIAFRKHLKLIDVSKNEKGFIVKVAFDCKDQNTADNHLQEELYEMLSTFLVDAGYSVEVV
jgi:hypothetical protein